MFTLSNAADVKATGGLRLEVMVVTLGVDVVFAHAHSGYAVVPGHPTAFNVLLHGKVEPLKPCHNATPFAPPLTPAMLAGVHMDAELAEFMCTPPYPSV